MLGVEAGAAAVDVITRVLKLESDYASLKKTVANLQAEMRKLRSETV
jgi:predicted ATP-grasp superfamily ATP-dependent carboligase